MLELNTMLEYCQTDAEKRQIKAAQRRREAGKPLTSAQEMVWRRVTARTPDMAANLRAMNRIYSARRRRKWDELEVPTAAEMRKMGFLPDVPITDIDTKDYVAAGENWLATQEAVEHTVPDTEEVIVPPSNGVRVRYVNAVAAQVTEATNFSADTHNLAIALRDVAKALMLVAAALER